MAMVKVLDIQRMSSEDGPGLRTTAFLKGCPLKCGWCHNPESIAFHNEVLWMAARCMGCNSCIPACPGGNIITGEDGIEIRHESCEGCYACCRACPTGALEGKGWDWQVEDLLRELLKDRAYFGKEGGITLSGGEALAQRASIDLLKRMKEEGVNTAVDTCGLLPDGQLLEALQHCDVLLFDMKLAKGDAHKEHTGADNEIIFKNLAVAGRWAQAGGRLWIRTPIIPGATDSEENIAGIGKALNGIANIERWELCAFNNLCGNKYRSLGLAWAYDKTPLVGKKAMENLLDIAKKTNACSDTRATGTLADG